MRMLFVLLLVPLLMACSSSGGTGNQPRGQLNIDSIEIRIAESSPVQVFANVKGSLGDGCTSLGAITQKRSGNTIDVTVGVNHSGAQVCTAIAQLVDQNIQLEGEFPPGNYTVRVNGMERTFTV